MSDTKTPSGRDLDIAPVTIEEEMRRSYLDYAMSVIVARALPDARDGLKPVHRRILFGMKNGGYDANKPYRKSAKIVGEVMGNFHPHGDGAIYDALVRLAQPFSMRVPLIDGQGNFGSMDGDPPAAMRYTESRLAKAGEAILADYNLDTVDFQPNYDDSSFEPMVLPSRIPNLLVNGAGGIAVGMATNIPTHNLGEVIDACCALVDNPDLTVAELMELVPGPDFPTGGLIIGRGGIRSAYTTGNGSVTMRAKTRIEDIRKDRQAIIVDELPYQINLTRLYERIKELVSDKVIEGISDVRDESDRSGVRIVIELKRDAVADVVLNQLFRHTGLQSNFPVNMLALDQGRPRMFTLKDCISAFVVFREEVIRRRTAHLLGVARARAHILAGLGVAVANLDAMIKLIREAPDPATARAEMIAKPWPATEVAPLIRLIDEPGHPLAEDGTYRLSEEQAKAILDLRLHRLTGLERDKIGEELNTVVAEISELLSILASREKLLNLLKSELIDIKTQFATPRKTEIQDGEIDASDEDLIAREDMVVTITGGGYIKRVALSAYRAQNRGGKGRSGMTTKDEDFLAEVFVASTHTPLLIFTSRGMAYTLKVYRLPLGQPQSKGKALVNLLPLQQGESVSAVMAMPENEGEWGEMNIIFATAKGSIRRNLLSDFTAIRSNGLIAMKFEDDGDQLIGVRACRPDDDILLATRAGKAIRFQVDDVRVFAGRSSTGVRGIRLAEGDEVISLSILRHVDANADERAAYLKQSAALRRAEGMEGEDQEIVAADDESETETIASLSPERFLELTEAEEMILTATEFGLGKRSSAYAYRLTGRGGQGINAMALTQRSGLMAACFPVKETDQIMLVSDGGQLIRLPVDQIRIAGRQTQGVTLFRLADGEKVVSVADLTGEAAEVSDTEETD